mmetsp:Transcript_17944/g.42219  ORF Transcript_17944/g.42219 Transcript_17944/m.42219 type:complete len:302 (-) Transcript_17944:1376-2281(-)
MHPMTAMRTPGRCPVRAWILAVVSWRLKRVLPHEGQLMNSVLEIRMRDACKRLNDDSLRLSKDMISASQRMPSPRPSTKRLPKAEEASTTTSSSSRPSTAAKENQNITGTAFPSLKEVSIDMNLRARNVTPSSRGGFSRISLGFAHSTAIFSPSSDSSPVHTMAWPPSRSGNCSRVVGKLNQEWNQGNRASSPPTGRRRILSSTAAASCKSVTPSGKLSEGWQSTPIGTSRSILILSAAASETSPWTTAMSMLFQSFWTSPSARSRRPNLAQSCALSKPANSSAVAEASTEPSMFRGTSRG